MDRLAHCAPAHVAGAAWCSAEAPSAADVLARARAGHPPKRRLRGSNAACACTEQDRCIPAPQLQEGRGMHPLYVWRRRRRCCLAVFRTTSSSLGGKQCTVLSTPAHTSERSDEHGVRACVQGTNATFQGLLRDENGQLTTDRRMLAGTRNPDPLCSRHSLGTAPPANRGLGTGCLRQRGGVRPIARARCNVDETAEGSRETMLRDGD